MSLLRVSALSAAVALAGGAGVVQARVRVSAPQYPGMIAFVDTSTGSDDIGVMRSDGSQRHLLTRTLPLLGSPAVSPDGKTIALTFANRSIALVGANGSSARRITSATTDNSAPTWSRDGRLAYLRYLPAKRTFAIMVADARGRHQHVLATEPDAGGGGWLTWSRNGRYLRFGPTFKGAVSEANLRYVSIDVRTRHAVVKSFPPMCFEPLDRPGHPGDVACATGPIGRAQSIWLVRNGRRVRRIALGPAASVAPVTYPTWSPDGSAIAYTLDLTRVAVVSLRAGATPRTYRVGRLGPYSYELAASWSPDGRSLVVGAVSGNWSVRRLDLASGRIHTILQHTEDDTPRWSPDGSALAFLHHIASGATQLKVRALRGGGSVVAALGQRAGDGSFAWSPDSSTIAFVTGDGALDVAVTPAGAPRTLVSSGVTGGLAWSRDGQRIAYVTPRADGRSAIEVIEADGTPTVAFADAGLGLDLTWLADGRLVYVDESSSPYGTLALLGEAPAQATHVPVFANHAVGSPVDSRILVAELFNGKDNALFRLSVLGPDGAWISRSNFDGSIRGTGAWSPDGQAIAYPVALTLHPRLGIEVVSSADLLGPATVIAKDATDPSWGPSVSSS